MVDLHLHTNYSDGTDSVTELLEKAENNNLEVISITDHNSVSAYYELEKHPEIRNKFSGQIVVGSEIKAIFDNINIEILAYGIDYKKLNIKEENKAKVQNDILKHYIKVATEYNIIVDKTIKVDITNPNKTYACWVFCDEILKYKENEKILRQFGKIDRFTFYKLHESNPNSPFYYDTSMYYDECQVLVDKIHNAGGLAFLAHGLIYPFTDKWYSIEKILKTTNIDGLECIYPLFNEEDKYHMINLCKKYNKYISGGSDYHAMNKPNIQMGTGINNNIAVNKELIENWLSRIDKI